MSRIGAIFWLLLVSLAGFTTFTVKYAVQDIEDQLNRTRRQTVAEQQEIRVLTAEWTYLNQPERLAELNRRFLALSPITAKQLQRGLAAIPMRATPVAPDVLLASAPGETPPPAEDRALPIVTAAPAKREPSRGEIAQSGQREPAQRPDEILPVRLAKAEPIRALNSLDALIAQIADAR